MFDIRNAKVLGKLDEHVLERVLCTYHEWGFCSLAILSRLCSEYPSRLARYNRFLCEKKYIMDLGRMRVAPNSKLKGHWYAVTRKQPAPFTLVPTRRLQLSKTTTPGVTVGANDFTTTLGYVIPRHQVVAAYAVSWVADVLNFNMGAGGSYSTLGLSREELSATTTGFTIASEHLIRTLGGQNKNLTAEQATVLNASTTSVEGYNLSIPDARIYVRQPNVSFRIEVECSVKNSANYARLGDIFKSQGLPILYLYTSPVVMKKVSFRLNHPLISHVQIGDIDGLRDFFWKNGILFSFMPNGDITDPANMFPPVE